MEVGYIPLCNYYLLYIEILYSYSIVYDLLLLEVLDHVVGYQFYTGSIPDLVCYVLLCSGVRSGSIFEIGSYCNIGI